MPFFHLIKIVVDVSKVVSDIWLVLQSAAFRCLPFFAYFICFLLVLFYCIIATEGDQRMVLLLSADSFFSVPNSSLASQKFSS